MNLFTINTNLTRSKSKKKKKYKPGEKTFWWTNNTNCSTYNFKRKILHMSPCEYKLPFICEPKPLKENVWLKPLLVVSGVVAILILACLILFCGFKKKKIKVETTGTLTVIDMDTQSNILQVRQMDHIEPLSLPYQVNANFEDEVPEAENDNTGILDGIEAKIKKGRKANKH